MTQSEGAPLKVGAVSVILDMAWSARPVTGCDGPPSLLVAMGHQG